VARVDRTAGSSRALLALFLVGCGVETNGYVLRLLPQVDASIEREAAPVVDATAEEACAACPRVIVLNDESTTGQPGGEGGSAYFDSCPEGQVVVGYNGSLNPNALLKDGMHITVIGSIQTLCGRLSIDGPMAASATITSGDTLMSRPMLDALTDPWQSPCSPNKVVFAMAGGSGVAFDEVAFQCAALSITKGPSGDVVALDMSTVETLSANGGDAGSMPFMEACPGGKIARGSNIRAGAWVDAFGLICATPSIAPGDAGMPCCATTAQQTSKRAVDEPPLP
jgi:hypothetical protein